MRTTAEIITRIEAVQRGGDFFGTQTNDLLAALDFEHAKSYLREGVTAEQWAEAMVATEGGIRDAAAGYLEFAVGKALNHRGISASRSVDHFRAWVFLLGTDEQLAQLESTEYEQYGVPQLAVAAEILEIPMTWDALLAASPELANMAKGEPCEPGCDSGCGN